MVLVLVLAAGMLLECDLVYILLKGLQQSSSGERHARL